MEAQTDGGLEGWRAVIRYIIYPVWVSIGVSVGQYRSILGVEQYISIRV